ncbi:MAG: hypothetical protein JXR76_28645 [Deltaproteobacteria bacterium]|nr:hypothetical protein [Deltaproteobacteria bacterium]
MAENSDAVTIQASIGLAAMCFKVDADGADGHWAYGVDDFWGDLGGGLQ